MGGGTPARGGPPPAAAASSLELSRNSVTRQCESIHLGFELSKCRCDCWFCPDCCGIKGYNLRAELIPILETFTGLLMVSFSVDPTLFASPRQAFDYLRKRRCLSLTAQDLRRGSYLHSRRYFYVLEWQKSTEQVHFHVLFDASFIPFEVLLASWSKYRPADAGPVVGDRPPFGTVWISKPSFEGGALHAGRYATKYLTKVPEGGFPAWVMDMGRKCRIRRYSTSRGFWGRESEERSEPETHRQVSPRSYAERVSECGTTTNVSRVSMVVDTGTGEVDHPREWTGELDVTSLVLGKFPVDEAWSRSRILFEVQSADQACQAGEGLMGHDVAWIHTRWRGARGGAYAA